MARHAAAKTGDYPRFFATRRNTEILTVIAANEPTVIQRVADRLKLHIGPAQRSVAALVDMGIVAWAPMTMPVGRLLTLNGTHPAYAEVSKLLICLTRRFKPPSLRWYGWPTPTVVAPLRRVDPADLIGSGHRRDALVLTALLGCATSRGLQSALAVGQTNMHNIVKRLRDDGLLDTEHVEHFAMHRIARELPCRDAFVALLKKIRQLNPAYPSLATAARLAAPNLP